MTKVIVRFADDKMEPMSKMEGQHFVQLLQQQVDCHTYTVDMYILASGG